MTDVPNVKQCIICRDDLPSDQLRSAMWMGCCINPVHSRCYEEHVNAARSSRSPVKCPYGCGKILNRRGEVQEQSVDIDIGNSDEHMTLRLFEQMFAPIANNRQGSRHQRDDDQKTAQPARPTCQGSCCAAQPPVNLFQEIRNTYTRLNEMLNCNNAPPGCIPYDGTPSYSSYGINAQIQWAQIKEDAYAAQHIGILRMTRPSLNPPTPFTDTVSDVDSEVE